MRPDLQKFAASLKYFRINKTLKLCFTVREFNHCLKYFRINKTLKHSDESSGKALRFEILPN